MLQQHQSQSTACASKQVSCRSAVISACQKCELVSVVPVQISTATVSNQASFSAANQPVLFGVDLHVYAAVASLVQGMKTVVTVNEQELVNNYAAEAAASNEVWLNYADDQPPLRAKHLGDPRAALTPWLAHKVPCVLHVKACM